jgi:cell wall-associated NlpC family hydrolase
MRLKTPAGLLIISVLLLSSCGAAKKARIREEKVNKVIRTARTYTGTPYKWGGTTRSGMDCSGLLINSFSSIDYSIPRTSKAQSEIGKKVKIGDLQPGDLVFFATGKKKRKITHVGLVTALKGKKSVWFIHSSSSLGVVENNIYQEYYFKRFRFARRVL